MTGCRMWQTTKICPQCKGFLHVTRLENKLFCKKCYEYQEVHLPRSLNPRLTNTLDFRN